MLVSRPRRNREGRDGVATVELAVLLPLLAFLCVIAVDYARIYYFSQTITNCARNGAIYASDPYVAAESPYATLEEAALADASNLDDPDNQPTVSSATGVTADGRAYVEVTVTYSFETLTNFPGVPRTTTLARRVRMSVAPANPEN